MDKINRSDVGPTPAIDDTALRMKFAREAIQLGRLPVRRADRMWGGTCHGASCTVCGLSVTLEELGYELEFAQNGNPSVSHYLHVRCFAAWESECRLAESAGPGNETKHSGNGHDTGLRPDPA